MTKYKYLSLPSLPAALSVAVDVEHQAFPLFLAAVGSEEPDELRLGPGPTLLVGLGWLQVQGGPKVSAQPANGWVCRRTCCFQSLQAEEKGGFLL